jgi:hypothetical protein
MKWQDLALTQLGYVINLFLTFGVGIVAYLSREVMEHPQGFTLPQGRGFRDGVWLVGFSVGAGIVANVTRTLDFRFSRQAAFESWKGIKNFKPAIVAGYLGRLTWFIFYAQVLGFGVGVYLLAHGIWRQP